MTHVSWVNRSIFLATNTGTASFGIGAAVTGYMSPSSAGAIDGESYHYAAETTNGSGTVSAWEIGTGVYTATASTLARTALFSSSTNNTVNFATAPYVMLTAFAEDFETELDADTTFYVATTGSDSTGLGTVALPWATLQHAVDYLASIELGGFTATIQIADGTYVGVGIQKEMTSGFIVFNGNAVTPANVVIQPNSFGFNCFGISASNTVTIKNLTIDPQTTSTHVGVLSSGPGIIIFLENVSFISGGRYCLFGTNGPFFNVTGTWSIAGNWLDAIFLDTSQIEIDTSTITMVGTPAFSDAFIKIADQSLYHTFTSPPTFSGAATGKRFIVESGGVIQTGTNNLSYFPGNAAGEVLVGGQYDDFGYRLKLLANQNYYVATTGSDSNDGSSGSPWLTIQHAIDVISETIDGSNFNVIVNIGSGTFTGIGLKATVGICNLFFVGAGSANTTITDGPNDGTFNFGECISVNALVNCNVSFGGLTLSGTLADIDSIAVYTSGQSVAMGVDSTLANAPVKVTCSGVGIATIACYGVGSSIGLFGTITIDTAGIASIRSIGGGSISIPTTLTISSNPDCTPNVGLFVCSRGGTINCQAMVLSGTWIGANYICYLGGYIYTGGTNGSGITGGTLAGVVDSSSGVDENAGFVTTVASLPNPNLNCVVGCRGFVTDALNPVNGSTVVGGGSVKAPVYSNGTNWIVTGVTDSGGTLTVSTTPISGATAGSLLINDPSGGNVLKAGPVTSTTAGSLIIPSLTPISSSNWTAFNGSGRTDLVGGMMLREGEYVVSSITSIAWNNGADLGAGGADTYISRGGPQVVRVGQTTDLAAPRAQTLGVESVVAGTTNTAGVDWTFQGSIGTGNANGGNIIFKTTPAGTSGSSQNTPVAVFTIPPPGVAGNIAVGFTVSPGNGGTLTTGQTFTATALNGNYQYYTNNGAHTFANPSADCAIDVLVTNATNAGAITFSTFTVGTTGDALTTTNGNKFIISTRRINGTSTYLVKALQ